MLLMADAQSWAGQKRVAHVIETVLPLSLVRLENRRVFQQQFFDEWMNFIFTRSRSEVEAVAAAAACHRRASPSAGKR